MERPSWSRARVYYSDDGKQITRVQFRKLGSFDIDLRPWELWCFWVGGFEETSFVFQHRTPYGGVVRSD